MKHISKHQYGTYLGLLGVICLLAGLVAWVVQMTFGTVAAVLFIVGLICLLLYVVLNFKAVQAQLMKRSVKYGANTTVMILVVLGIIVLVEAISLRHNVQFDVTKDKRYTLSEQTRKLLTALDQDVTVTAFFTTDHGGRDVLEDLLKQYTHLSAHVQYEFIDPNKNPGRAQAYDITTNGTIVLETAEKQQKIFDLTEEALTNGFIKVTREGTKVIYVISGHGEHGVDDQMESGLSQVVQALKDENYEVKDLLLLQASSIPDDAAVVVLSGPKKELLPTELDVLTAYLNRNGRLLCMFDPGYAPETAAFLQAYGVTMDNTTIINANPLGQLMGAGPTMPVVTTFGQHPITETFTAASIFPLARSLTVEETLPEGISVDTLAFSSESSWGETSQEELESGTVELTEGSDIPGPLPLAVIITVASPVPVEGTEIETRDETETGAADEAESTGARIVVFGDSDFASNAYVGWVGNGDLVLNTLNWLAEEEDLVAIRAKDPEMSPLMLTAAQARMAFLLAVIVMPLAAIMIGVTIYVNRQKATR